MRTAQQLQAAAKGFLDPESDFFQQLLQKQRQAIGGQTAAQQRSAALAAAEGGFGAGASPEMLQMQAMLGQGGTEALGQAATDLQLAAPQMGAQLGQIGGTLGLRGAGLAEQSRQFGAGLGEQQRAFDVNAALQQQGIGQRASEFAQNYGLRAQDQMFRQQLAMQQLYNQLGY